MTALDRRVEPSEVRRAFIERFAKRPRLFSAPGRVNLIGEHTDYNDGFVMPIAIERRCYVAATRRSDRRIVVRSQNFASEFEFDLGEPAGRQRGIWGDYVEGVARSLIARGVELSGAELLVHSEVPPGAGLSASAALEISVGFALVSLFTAPDPRLVALAGQSAEHEYVGTLCGIMDQYVSALGVAEHALLIDCRSLDWTSVPFELGDACLVVCDTRVLHRLAGSEYNVRHAECEQARKMLSQVLPEVRALRDVTSLALAANLEILPEVLQRRCRHVVSENERTLEAAAALRRRDLHTVGHLMVASHRSLQKDFEVSCPELDVAVEAALSHEGVYGARMTGGGFGGCTITLVEASHVGQLIERISSRMRATFDVEPALFTTRAMCGVREHTDLVEGASDGLG